MSAILANSSASASGGMGMFGMIIWLVVIFGFMSVSYTHLTLPTT